MKALSVRQPWASLIASGKKTVELRSWSTSYRGTLLILAGAAVWRGEHSYPIGPRGVALCTVELVDVRPAVSADADAAGLPPPRDHFAWVLRDAKPLEFLVPAKGRLGLYSPDLELCQAVGLL